mmetsp:Transcript_17306/g.26978  ORF Transcript_17306/g.26978 Transcript_17306/m.26978 type:complete len:136 (+) Transcript_17306:2037-2444(+)
MEEIWRALRCLVCLKTLESFYLGSNLFWSILVLLETWRALNLNITVKAHLLETHVLSQFQKFGGLGDFIEEFLEQRHQYTKKRKRAMGGVADPQKRYDGIAKLNRLHNLSSIKEAQNSVLQASKRPEILVLENNC